MKRSVLADSCCTTPSAMWLWGAMFAVFYGAGLLLRIAWPGLQHYGDTIILVALAGACFVNFGRNRTLHCGITGPLFLAGAIVAVLMDAGIWDVDHGVLWGVVLSGVAIAFFIEWRTVGRQRRGSNA
jgi:hypothetical protein